jgi:hypothetical protein
MKGSYLRPEFSQADVEQRLDAAGAKYIVLADEAFLDACDRRTVRRESRRLVSGTNGIWALSAGRTFDSGRCALSEDAVHAQPKSEVS